MTVIDMTITTYGTEIESKTSVDASFILYVKESNLVDENNVLNNYFNGVCWLNL